MIEPTETQFVNSIPYVGIFFVALSILFTKKILGNQTWRATMTPLASVIGSGFLISAPLLNDIAGDKAIWPMFALCLLAYGVGEVIRWNIKEVEPLHEKGITGALSVTENLSNWSLGFAYILSITYYLYLFSSFLTKATGYHSDSLVKALTVATLFLIAWYGHQQGLKSIENIESVSVNVKLSVIISFLAGLAVFFFTEHRQTGEAAAQPFKQGQTGVILGLLIMVQGFETSRYLSSKYDARTRVKSMRLAQILSAAIYLVFIGFFTPVFELHPLHEKITETSVIDIGKYVFGLAPTFLLIAAVASQLSAAVADMGGAGGLFSEQTGGKIKPGQAYILIACISALITVFLNIFEIISFASKAFALFYLLQCLSSLIKNFKTNKLKSVFSTAMALLCLSVLVFGKPFE